MQPSGTGNVYRQGRERIYPETMPGTGHLHDPVCETFDPPPELSGLGQVNGQAIVTDEAGGTMLKLDFPLSVKGGRAAPVADPGEAASSAVASPAKLRLLAMLHYLWEAAGLNKWRSTYGRRRSWFIIHRELMAAAAKVSTKGRADLWQPLCPPALFHRGKGKARRRTAALPAPASAGCRKAHTPWHHHRRIQRL